MKGSIPKETVVPRRLGSETKLGLTEMARVKRLITKLAFQALALPPSDRKDKHPKRQFCNLVVVTLHFRISCLRQCRKHGTFPFAATVERLTAKTKVIRT